MSHVTHLLVNKAALDQRFAIIKAVREWFWDQGFTEVEAPILLASPDQEPTLTIMKTAVLNERGQSFAAYLHTSPEYTMKKMLAAGFAEIFYLGKVFRNQESFGGTHNPEFTMVEWYRPNVDFFAIMDDVEKLCNSVLTKLGKPQWSFSRYHMRDLWKKFVGVNLDEYVTLPQMYALCQSRGYNPAPDEGYEDVFYRIFLNEIEPNLVKLGPVIIHHYPLPMAALSRQSSKEVGYAERFEVYIKGIELGNAYSELTGADEQRARLNAEKNKRLARGKDLFPIDEDFIEAVGQMPDAAGIALGIDRLVQAVLDIDNINAVLPLSAKNLFLNE